MKNIFLKVLGLGIGLGVLYWLISKTGTSAILQAMRTVQISDILCAVSLLLMGIYLRALRWRSLFPNMRKMSVYPFFSAIMIGALANNLLPARGGDLVRVYILGKNTPLSKSYILATVLIERLSELILICLMSLLVLYVIPMPEWIHNFALITGSASLIGLVALLVLSKYTSRFSTLFLKLLNLLPKRITHFFEPILREFIQGTRGVLSRRSFFQFITLTILIWGMEVGVLWFFAKSFGFILSFFESWLVMIYAVLACFVPLLPAQIGVMEFAIQSSMAFMGYEGPATLAFALSWHFTVLLVGSIGGVVCLFLNGNSLFATYAKVEREMSS